MAEDKIKIPKNVLVDAIKYTIEETDDVLVEGNQVCVGLITYADAKIQLDKRIGEGCKPQVLMHELIHAITAARMPIDFEQDETYVDALASGVVNLIRQNPELIDYIRGGNKNE